MNFLYHNSNERKATIVLLVLVVLLWGVSWLWPSFVAASTPQIADEALAEIEAFEAAIVRKEIARQEKYKHSYPRQKAYKPYPKSDKKAEELKLEEVELFSFDPNTASFDDFKALGLSARTAHSILNYRESGGSFQQKKDLAKIYTLAVADFDRLQAYIALPDSLPSKPQTQYASREEEKAPVAPVIIELNRASAEDLQGLRGIGPSFSKRIVKYRQSLGGFIKIEQLAEVYGLPDSTFQSIREQLSCTPTAIQKLNINKATAAELKSHPYLRWRHANAIVNWRKKHGPYKDIEFLRTLFEFDDGKGTYWKIEPYLSLD